jgi:hypothetical protein
LTKGRESLDGVGNVLQYFEACDEIEGSGKRKISERADCEPARGIGTGLGDDPFRYVEPVGIPTAREKVVDDHPVAATSVDVPAPWRHVASYQAPEPGMPLR